MKTWTEKYGRFPSRCEGYYRWTLPDSMSHKAPDLLPDSVFHKLESREKFPWLFHTIENAIIAANIAAAKAGNPPVKN